MRLSRNLFFLPAVVSTLTCLALTAPARADYTFAPFSVNALDMNSIGSLALTGAPVGAYNAVQVSFDWTAGAGDPWSEEALWALVDTDPSAPSNFFYSNPGASPVGVDNGSPVTLTWDVNLNATYQGGDPLFFWFAQDFDGSDANWDNVSITLKNAFALPSATPVSVPSSTTSALLSGEVNWFSFNYTGGKLVIDTLGSLLTPSNDTEIALYNSAGDLIATNDDIDAFGGDFLSQITIDFDTIPMGTYYVALGGFDTVFGSSNFVVNATSELTGTAVLNVVVSAPEPATLALVALALPIAGVVRRRRSA